MTEERIKSFIIQSDDSIRYRKQLLDYEFAKELLNVIPTCINNQEVLESRLNEKTKQCERFKIDVESAQEEIAKMYTHQCEKNSYLKEFLNFAIFLTTFRDSNEEIDAISNLKDDDLLRRYNISLDEYDFDESIENDVKPKTESLNSQLDESSCDKCKNLKTSPIVANENILTSDSKLENVHELLRAEISRRKQVESERDNLDYLSEKLCCLLLKYQKLICPFDKAEDSNTIKSNDDSIKDERIRKSISPKSKLLSSKEIPDQIHFNGDTCGKLFPKKNNITGHFNMHMKTNASYHCEKCNKSYPVTNDGQNLIKCPACDVFELDKSRGDRNKSKLTNKKLATKNQESAVVDDLSDGEISNLRCDICGQNYPNKYNLKIHIRHVHYGKEIPECTICGKQFDCEWHLKTHALSHGSKKNFKCSICKQSFKFPSDKRKHERMIHKGEYRFQCAHCDKRCGTKQALISHIFARHFPEFEKPFKCTICSKTFATKSYLMKHKLFHSSNKPEKC